MKIFFIECKILSQLYRIMLLIVLLFMFWYLSVFFSRGFNGSDFPAFYYAASTIMDFNTPNHAIYEIDLKNKYNIPEIPFYHDFLYSISAAYILSPLALLPYYKAKSMMMFLNILMYLGGVSIALRLGGATGRIFLYPLVFSLMWMPFIANFMFGQVNAILFFLISAALLAATRNYFILCGILLGVSALFKLFPIAIAMLLGLKNWRILAVCFTIFGLSFLMPGSLKWFSVIGNIYPAGYTPIYLWLKDYGDLWFLCYAGSIAIITALIVHRSKQINYPLLGSFAIPAMFLTMPLVQYYHLTILMFPFAYLLATALSEIAKKLNKMILLTIFLSFVIIQFQLPLSRIIGLFLIWIILGYQMTFEDNDIKEDTVKQRIGYHKH